jgi:hypothetical protein
MYTYTVSYNEIISFAFSMILLLTWRKTSHNQARWLHHLTMRSLSRKQTESKFMTCSVFETMVSHGSDLIWEKTEYPKGLANPYTLFGSRLQMSGKASLGSMPHSYDTKTWSQSEKLSAQQTEWDPGPGGQRLGMLYELGAWQPQSWELSRETHGHKT